MRFFFSSVARGRFLTGAGMLAFAAASGAIAPGLDLPGLMLRFDDEHGALVSFMDTTSGHEHIDAAHAGGLWSLAFQEDKAYNVTPEDAGRFRWHLVEEGEAALILKWDAFGIDSSPDLEVEVSVSKGEGKGLSQWHIQVNHLAGAQPTRVRFPVVPAITRQERETFAVPYWMGEKTTRARELLSTSDGQGRRREWTYPGLLSLQCMTLYSDQGPGFYVATNDIQARSKSFAIFGDGQGGLGLEVCHFPAAAEEADSSYSPEYAVLLGAFEGDWITAAEEYRHWGVRQPWALESRLKTGATPSWAVDTGFWIWNRGHSPGVLGPASVLRAYLDMPVSVFWHWWHGCAYDVNFPEYLPPREGSAPFRAALKEAQKEDIHAIVYMNQRLWGMTADSWVEKQAERYAVKGPDGTIRPEIYNTFTQSPCASMCMGAAFWRNTYADLAGEAFHTLDVNGIYMDQACSSLVCYAPDHGHVPGGGAYWMDGFRTLESDIRARCPDIVLAGEGCGEAWLPHLDLMLSLQVSLERYAAPGQWTPIPFFHAVYHGYTLLYGNYCSLTHPPYDALWPEEFAPEKPLQLLPQKFSDQFRLEQARAFVWGQQPTLANFLPEHLETRPAEMAYVRDLARLRNTALPYLLHGTFTRPPHMDIPHTPTAMSRLSIYAGQHDAVQEYEAPLPHYMVGVWRADTGNLAVAVASVFKGPHALAFTLTTEAQGLPESGILYKHTPTTVTQLGRFEGGQVEVTDNLPDGSACIFEFVAE